MGRWLGLTALVVAAAFSVALVAYVAITQPRGVEYVRVVPRGFEYTPFITYVAELYVGDRVVRSLYVRVVESEGYSRMLVSLGWRESSEVVSLEVELSPPPGRVVPDIAWVAGLGGPVPVEFYRRGPAVTWRCRDLGHLGMGTVTLEFILVGQDLEGYTIRVRGTVRYGGRSYLLDHQLTLPRL